MKLFEKMFGDRGQVGKSEGTVVKRYNPLQINVFVILQYYK